MTMRDSARYSLELRCCTRDAETVVFTFQRITKSSTRLLSSSDYLRALTVIDFPYIFIFITTSFKHQARLYKECCLYCTMLIFQSISYESYMHSSNKNSYIVAKYYAFIHSAGSILISLDRTGLFTLGFGREWDCLMRDYLQLDF